MNGTAFGRVMADILNERHRTEELKASGRFKYTLADAGMAESEKAACLMEELGEVCRNVLARMSLVTDGERSDDALYGELLQVAALSVAWMELLKEAEPF